MYWLNSSVLEIHLELSKQVILHFFLIGWRPTLTLQMTKLKTVFYHMKQRNIPTILYPAPVSMWNANSPCLILLTPSSMGKKLGRFPGGATFFSYNALLVGSWVVWVTDRMSVFALFSYLSITDREEKMVKYRVVYADGNAALEQIFQSSNAVWGGLEKGHYIRWVGNVDEHQRNE